MEDPSLHLSPDQFYKSSCIFQTLAFFLKSSGEAVSYISFLVTTKHLTGVEKIMAKVKKLMC